MQDNLSIAEYMQQPRAIRDSLRQLFNLPRTGKTETVTDATGVGRCINDGTTYVDLSHLTFDKLITYIGESTPEDNIHSLFTKAVTKIEELHKKVGAISSPPPVAILPIEEKKVEPVVVVEPPKVVDPNDIQKCPYCAFQTMSLKALPMHMGRMHKYNK